MNKFMVSVIYHTDHDTATFTRAQFRHRNFTGQAVKQFTSTRCLHFHKKLLVTSVHVNAVVQCKWPYKGFHYQSQRKWPEPPRNRTRVTCAAQDSNPDDLHRLGFEPGWPAPPRIRTRVARFTSCDHIEKKKH